MRILLDFEMNRESETYNGIRIADIEEIVFVNLTPVWHPNSNIDNLPDELCVELYTASNPSQEFAIQGWYFLDGSDVIFNAALENYNKVVNQLLLTGYAKISDFKNINWL